MNGNGGTSTGSNNGGAALGEGGDSTEMFAHMTVALKAMSEVNKNCDTVRQRSIESLHNIIHSQPDSPQANREIKVVIVNEATLNCYTLHSTTTTTACSDG